MPYMSNYSTAWRDPLRLGRLFPDVWAVGGMLAIAFLLLRAPWLGLMFAGILASNMLVTASVPLMNIRYSYAVVPIYVVAFSCVWVSLRVASRKMAIVCSAAD